MMVLLGDVVFMLVAKDPDALWDPIGGALLRLAARRRPQYMAGRELFERWAIGAASLGAAIDRRPAPRARGSRRTRGQQRIARGFVIALAAIGATVAARLARARARRRHRRDRGARPPRSCSRPRRRLRRVARPGGRIAPLGRVVDAVRRVVAVLSRVGGGDAGAVSLPARRCCSATIVLDYYLGIWIERTEDPWKRKALVDREPVLEPRHPGLLQVHRLLHAGHRRLAARTAIKPLRPDPAGRHLVPHVPVASYTIDVYRRELKATQSVVQFATFVLFFPQLVAGPIVRAQDLLPQLETLPRARARARRRHGLFRIVVGLFKKIAIADTLALVDRRSRVRGAGARSRRSRCVGGVYGYALQIYLDFSAYSDIAIGSAQVLGFTLPENFRTPYRSREPPGVLAALAHLAVDLAARLPLHPARRQQAARAWRTYVNLIADDAARRAVARRELGVHRVGRAARLRARGDAVLPARTAAAMSPRRGRCSAAASLLAGARHHRRVPRARRRVACGRSSSIGWLCVTPLWAVVTAWLGQRAARQAGARAPGDAVLRGVGTRRSAAADPEILRIAMCASASAFFVALQVGEQVTWIPLIASDLAARRRRRYRRARRRAAAAAACS